uniref:ABC1 atypical kinase-like domain-containing protein n=1 Tax=Panagrolaimus sp. PS1159 TaxID=55785 RepID=A0AC35GDY7_9BILA
MGSKSDWNQVFKTFQLLTRSQLGHEGKKVQDKISEKVLQTIVGGGNVVKPFDPEYSAEQERRRAGNPFGDLGGESFRRAQIIASGVNAFTKLGITGALPGSGGHIVTEDGVKVEVKKKLAPLPSPLEMNNGLRRIFQQRPPGMTAEEEDYLVKAAEEVGNVFPKNQLLDPDGNPVEIQPSPVEDHIVHMMKHKKYAPMGTTENETVIKVKHPSMETIKAPIGTGQPDTVVKVQHPLHRPMNTPLSTTGISTGEPIFDRGERINMPKHEHLRYDPTLPEGYQVKTDDIRELQGSHERAVPSSRIGRFASFASLAVGLSSGAAVEATKRAFGFGNQSAADGITSSNPFLTPANAERIVQTLCRVRGAALKLGQMLSIQDEDMVPKYLLDIFERVRQNADYMPLRQLNKQMSNELGPNWREKFSHFEDRPFAAASIGQVHRARALDGREIVVKIQYPGVAEGIDSDIDNLVSIMNIGGLFPDQMFLGNFVKVARRELKAECDYEREARAQTIFRDLMKDDNNFFIPEVFPELSTRKILTTEFVPGVTIDKCIDEPQVVRDYVAAKFIELCLNEIFTWRFMQTDPNWSNFFFGRHPQTGEPRLVLLDFGASRSYSKQFVDDYMHIIRAAYDMDRPRMLEYSRKIGFLTGYENKAMENAHCDSIEILGETLASRAPFDFAKQRATRKIRDLIPVMLEHRLTSPPEEIYSLHRKLSGSFLLATKLRAVVACGPMFDRISSQYRFGDDGTKDIDIEQGQSPYSL